MFFATVLPPVQAKTATSPSKANVNAGHDITLQADDAKAIAEGKLIGYQGSGTGRPIYELIVNGQQQRIAVTIGNNGYIVGANPRGSAK